MLSLTKTAAATHQLLSIQHGAVSAHAVDGGEIQVGDINFFEVWLAFAKATAVGEFKIAWAEKCGLTVVGTDGVESRGAADNYRPIVAVSSAPIG